ncbi:MAG TPA: ferredoxin-thioredoxin reductase catalytic domain-containing protein [Methanoregulaceae archaeon]|nr:ferredoxin-thioredoxin reductase catalytic domain-containing protein [Methanoregulaceae archaeon]HQJ88489.1 ferredoxin-thioredoxin reductase catalytic domain-containing protein [Methanoregulaceae archaeon]
MTVKDPENEEEMRAWAEAEAESNGIRLNPDERQLAVVIRGLVRNRERFGERYCPCRIRTGDPEKDQQIICPCIFRDEELKADGRCHCNLFFTKE